MPGKFWLAHESLPGRAQLQLAEQKRRTEQLLWSFLHICVLPFYDMEANPGEELKLYHPYHFSSFLLPIALDGLTYLNSQCKAAIVYKVTAAAKQFSDMVHHM